MKNQSPRRWILSGNVRNGSFFFPHKNHRESTRRIRDTEGGFAKQNAEKEGDGRFPYKTRQPFDCLSFLFQRVFSDFTCVTREFLRCGCNLLNKHQFMRQVCMRDGYILDLYQSATQFLQRTRFATARDTHRSNCSL